MAKKEQSAKTKREVANKEKGNLSTRKVVFEELGAEELSTIIGGLSRRPMMSW